MRRVPEWMWDVWRSGQFYGDNRPNTRATISKSVLRKDASNFRSLLFGDSEFSYELPNIKSVQIDRRLQTDAATCTINLTNQIPIDPTANLDLNYQGGTASPTRRDLKELGQPGYYTFRRGLVVGSDHVSNPWNHDVSGIWADMLIPNRLIKVFQGYGTDGAGAPAQDTRLVLTGVFLIDKVDFKANGDITIACRDMAKLLIEQRLYPPIIPLDDYPLEIMAEHTEFVEETFFYDALPTTFTGEATAVSSYHGAADQYTFGDSSVAPYYGFNASIYGHRASDAFDGEWSSYWLSVGYNEQNATWSYAWLSALNGGNWINRVQFVPIYGGHKVYLSIKVGGSWIGGSTIPASNFPIYYNGADIPYVQVATVSAANEYFVFSLDYSYQVDEVRLTFTNLQYDGRGTYPYRAGVREFQCYNVAATGGTPIINQNEGTREVAQVVEGNITDYTEIVKLFAAWAGFWWPDGPYDTFFDLWDGTGSGRVWGDFFYSGAYPVEPPTIPDSYWDNKSIMDGINQIKEILGFVFYIDSYGGIIWRPPNIWKTGNYITGTGYVGEDAVPMIDEDQVLIDYGVSIDDTNLRSDIIVVSADDPSVHGSFQPGFASGETIPTAIDTSDLALLGGQQRIMLIPNYPFGKASNPQSQREVEKFAFLVSLWIHWSYRKARIRIPGMPAFEPDDQVRLKERVTSDTYVHYLQGISSNMNLDAGTWYMDLDTHWLGSGPNDTWVINAKDMHPALFAYLKKENLLAQEVLDDQTLWPDDWFEYEEPVVPDDIPRFDDDLNSLFPDPPEIEYAPADFDFENDSPGDYTVAPGGGGGGGGGTVLAGTNSWASTFWGPHCGDSNMVTRKFINAFAGTLTGSTHINQTDNIWITVDARGWKAWVKLMEVFVEYDFELFAGQCWSYECRKVKLLKGGFGNSWSNHAWGLAIDLNSEIYPQGQAISSGTMYTIGKKAENKIRTASGAKVFKWGNSFGTPDPMHFQIIATPAQIAEGVVVNP